MRVTHRYESTWARHRLFPVQALSCPSETFLLGLARTGRWPKTPNHKKVLPQLTKTKPSSQNQNNETTNKTYTMMATTVKTLYTFTSTVLIVLAATAAGQEGGSLLDFLEDLLNPEEPTPFPPPTPGPVRRPTPAPVQPTMRSPTSSPMAAAGNDGGSTIVPNMCQVDLLVSMMEMAVRLNRAIAPQWLRLAFHDAGTFNQQVPEGGANGCLLTDDSMAQQPENRNLDMAIRPLRTVQRSMMQASAPELAIRLSSADLIQFAGFFVAVRQRGTPGLNQEKMNELRTAFEWGRPDEPNCQTDWADNLPGIELNADRANIPQRCSFAGGEIRRKMMDRNGFTAREATALIGAHTIGLTRNVFGAADAGPWTTSGADEATPQGPVFDNGFHDFLINSIPARTVQEFSAGRPPAPFTRMFPNWFKVVRTDLNYLDTDLVLAFPSQNTNAHPHFDTFTREFAGSNEQFINAFMAALDKMSKLGVRSPLRPARPCTAGADGPTSPASAPAAADFVSGMMVSVEEAEEGLAETMVERQDEIVALTTPVCTADRKE
jgi:hypothetical protein